MTTITRAKDYCIDIVYLRQRQKKIEFLKSCHRTPRTAQKFSAEFKYCG